MRGGKPGGRSADRQSTLLSTVATAVVCILLAATGLTVLHYGARSSASPQQATSKNQRQAAPTAPQGMFAQQPCTPVYAKPDTGSTLLSQLLGGTDVTALEQTSAGGTTWQHVRFWSGLDGYIPAGALGARPPSPAREGSCPYPGVPEPQPDLLPASHGPFPLTASGTTTTAATLYPQPSDKALPAAALPLGVKLSISKWASDDAGRPWYLVSADGVSGWVWSGGVRLDHPNPATHQVRGAPIWKPVAGKGMLFTNYVTHHSDIDAIIRAAQKAGLTHLYIEVAISQFGFYARNSLDRLLPAAHKVGIAVIAWVYPTLKDISADVRLTAEVAAYKTPSGDHADGIATDVEEVDDSASVYTYGQLVRALIGPDTLLVAHVFHPFAQIYYPYAAVATSWNVILPMNYWHSRANHAYSQADVRRFVANSITTVQAAMGADGSVTPLPVEELGQMYDMYTEDGTGAKDAPTGPEITADIDAARASGSIGVSYFEWQTATQAQWAALTAYKWPNT